MVMDTEVRKVGVCAVRDDYTAPNSLDCYDDPDNGDILPGNHAFPPPTAVMAALINCDGEEQTRWDSMEEECTGFDLIVDTCGGSPGWSGDSLPVVESPALGTEIKNGGGLFDRGCEWKDSNLAPERLKHCWLAREPRRSRHATA